MGLYYGISLFVFFALLWGTKINLSIFASEKKLGIVLVVYLLTIGLVVSPMVNSVLIVGVFIVSSFKKLRIDKYSFILLLLNCAYLILNTCIIYAYKSYSPAFNPYVGLVEYLMYYVYFLFLKSMNLEEDDKEKLLEVISLFSIGVFTVGVLEIFSSGVTAVPRILSIFRNPNLLGIYSAVIFALNFSKKRVWISRRLTKLATFCSFILLLFSQSRVSWLGALVFLFLIFLHSNVRSKAKYILLGVFALVLAVVLFHEEVAYLLQVRILPSFNREDFSTSDRIQLFLAAMDIFWDNVLFGTGIRSFLSEIGKYGYIFWSNMAHPHNAYIELLQSLGLVGFILQFGLVFRVIACRKHKRDRLFFVAIMFFAFGIFNRMFNEFATTMFLWTVLAFL